MNDDWRDVVGYEGIYSVNARGEVKRLVSRFGHAAGGLMAVGINAKNKYAYVCLCRDGKAKTTRLHKVVAAAFYGPCPNGMQINHKDGRKTNNAANNLEYVTQSENMLHAYRNGLQKPRLGSDVVFSKLTVSQVEQIMLLEGTATHFEIGKRFGVDRKTISSIYSGFSWSHFTGRKFENRNRTLGTPGKGKKCQSIVA